MKTDNGRANAIGTYEVFFGDYRKLYAAASEYQRVTVEDVRLVAAAYFEEKNRTVATLMPEPPLPSTRFPYEISGETSASGISKGAPAQWHDAALDGAAQAAACQLRPDPQERFVADPAGAEGTASVTASLLRHGTQRRIATEYSRDLDFIGGTFHAGATADYTSVSAEFMKKDLAAGLDLLAEPLLEPAFPDAEVGKRLRQRMDGILAAKDQAQHVLGAYFNAYLFGGHPYGRPAAAMNHRWRGSTATRWPSSTVALHAGRRHPRGGWRF